MAELAMCTHIFAFLNHPYYIQNYLAPFSRSQFDCEETVVIDRERRRERGHDGTAVWVNELKTTTLSGLFRRALVDIGRSHL